MQKVIVSRYGGPEVLSLAETEDPQPGPGHLLVSVAAAGVNYLDIYQREGKFSQSELPFTPGLEGTGTVVSTGAGVTTFRPGDRVSWINRLGSYANLVILPAEIAIALPASLKVETSLERGLLFQAVTAQYLSTEFRSIRPGDNVLVHAAAGGVGQLLVQWLKHLGARVLATASTPEKLKAAEAGGADVLINYRDVSFLEATRDATGGRGVILAFDAVGKTTLEDTLASLAPRGTAVLYGTASGNPPLIDPLSLINGSRRLAAGELFEHIGDPAELQQRARAVLDALEQGWLQLKPGRRYPLAEAAKAQTDLEARVTDGKLLLLP